MKELNLTKENFAQEVLNSDKPVVVDFWAPWCGPCRMMAPVLEEFAEKNDGKYKVAKVNVDEQPELASQYEIMSIPSLLVFKSGKLTATNTGYVPKDIIEKLVEQN